MVPAAPRHEEIPGYSEGVRGVKVHVFVSESDKIGAWGMTHEITGGRNVILFLGDTVVQMDPDTAHRVIVALKRAVKKATGKSVA